MKRKKLALATLLGTISLAMIIISCFFHEISIIGLPIPLLVCASIILQSEYVKNRGMHSIWLDYLTWLIANLYLIPINAFFLRQRWVYILIPISLVVGLGITLFKQRQDKNK